MTPLFAAVVAGGISAVIAFCLFRNERRARLKDREADEQRRADERRQDYEAELRLTRGTVCATVIDALRAWLIPPGGRRISPEAMSEKARAEADFQSALMVLLLDGTEDSLTVHDWVKLRASLPEHNFDPMRTCDSIRAKLIAWIRGEPGAIESMRRTLKDASEDASTDS